MKLIFSIIVLSLMSTSCNKLPKEYLTIGHVKTSKNMHCTEVLTEITKKWAHHKKYKTCYFLDKKLVANIIQNSDCFIGWTSEEVKQQFGIPMYQTKNKLKYSLSSNCTPTDTLFAFYSLYFELSNDFVNEIYQLEAAIMY